MEKSMITTNFFPIENQDFIIPIYKRECNDQETKKNFPFSVKVFKLTTDNSIEAKNFFITFDEQNGFIDTTIPSSDNRNLTIWYLSYLVKQKCDFLKLSCKIGNDFKNIIDFQMKKTELGQESICIIPSYQNKKYGIILDYHFFKNKDVPFSIEIQKKSLSLDHSGRSNKNYYSDKFDKINFFSFISF